jgi:hypothetical protein
MSKQNQNIDQDTGEFSVHRSRRGTVVAAIICLLLSVVIWAVVMNAQDTFEVELALPEAPAGYTYTLSDNAVEIKGRILDIKRVESIKIVLPEEFLIEGTHPLSLEHLVLPEGLSPAAAVEITLTVTKTAS